MSKSKLYEVENIIEFCSNFKKRNMDSVLESIKPLSKPVIEVKGDKECCTICSERFDEEDDIILKCGHEYHYYCLFEWIIKGKSNGSKKCPYCNANLGYAQIYSGIVESVRRKAKSINSTQKKILRSLFY